MNIQKKSPIEIASEICDLFDEHGFTSDKQVDTNVLINKIAEIIENGTNPIYELVSGVKGEPFPVQSVNITNVPCVCCNLPTDPFERQPGE